MTNGVYLHLKFKSTLPTSTVEFIQACINSPKDGLMYISNYRDIPETWLTLWGTHPEWPQWYARTLAFNKDGTSTLQLASASNLSTVPILKSFIESVLPYTDSTGLIGLFITKPWIEYPKLLTVHKGKLRCRYCSRWADLTQTTPDLTLLEKIIQLPQLLR